VLRKSTCVLTISLFLPFQFDVTEERPDEVLSTLWRNLTEAEAAGDADAAFVRKNLRILVAGGDGTVTWVLGAILALGLTPAPPVAVMPLGTGNDFSFNFGWGTKFEWSWVKPDHLYRTLARYHDAAPREMDVWRAHITAPSPDYFVEMPHSLRQNPENPSESSACFWNYFSVGLDAEAAYGFHHLRETHPKLASGRLVNQAWYSVFTCATGWFCGAAPLANGVTLRVRDAVGGEWREIPVPSSVRAVVLLNLQTYGGGRDIWGLAHTSTLAAKGLSEPIYDDGVIEVLGFRSGWHTAVVMGQISPKVHAKRLAQAREVELSLSASGARVKGERGTVYMQLDGEPWPQEVPAKGDKGAGGDQETLRVRITTAGQSRVLVNGGDAVGNRKSQWVTNRGLSMGLSEARRDGVVEEGSVGGGGSGGGGEAR
jgi:diacylglycerol kinase (ATP)